MKIEVLNDFKNEDGVFIAGEVRIVSDSDGEYFCRAGWVKDMDGVVETAKPSLNEVILKVANSSHGNKVEVA